MTPRLTAALTFILVTAPTVTVAQNAPALDYAHVAPEPVGGLVAVAERVRYPDVLETTLPSGQVVVQFVVELDGTASGVVAVRSPDSTLAAAAVAAVQASPFTVGRHDGQPVRVRRTLPLTFEFTDAPDTPKRDVVETPPHLIGGLAALSRSVRYPEAARRTGIEGVVYVQFMVGVDGVPTRLRIARSSVPSLNQAALAAVREQRFEPATRDGVPVEMSFMAPISFRLR